MKWIKDPLDKIKYANNSINRCNICQGLEEIENVAVSLLEKIKDASDHRYWLSLKDSSGGENETD